MRQGGGVLERDALGDEFDRPLPDADVLGEGPLALAVEVPEDRVPRPEPGDRRSHGFHDAGHVDADPRVPRCPDAQEQPDEGRPWLDPVEVGPVDRRVADADEDLVVARLRSVELHELHDLGAAVPGPDGGAHRAPSYAAHDPDNR